MIEKGATNFDEGLFYACHNGHLEIVQLLIENGANDFEYGLTCACRAGHMDIVRLMIDMGATDFNEGLWCACLSNHIEIISLMIDKGATDFAFLTKNQVIGLLNVGVNFQKLYGLCSDVMSNRQIENCFCGLNDSEVTQDIVEYVIQPFVRWQLK